MVCLTLSSLGFFFVPEPGGGGGGGVGDSAPLQNCKAVEAMTMVRRKLFPLTSAQLADDVT